MFGCGDLKDTSDSPLLLRFYILQKIWYINDITDLHEILIRENNPTKSILSTILLDIDKEYDYVIIDVPTATYSFFHHFFQYANEIICPITLTRNVVLVKILIDNITLAQEFNPNLKLRYIIPTMARYDEGYLPLTLEINDVSSG